jgi:hypothetical protein
MEREREGEKNFTRKEGLNRKPITKEKVGRRTSTTSTSRKADSLHVKREKSKIRSHSYSSPIVLVPRPSHETDMDMPCLWWVMFFVLSL